MNVTLVNTTRRMKVVNLPHDSYCTALGRCACTEVGGRRLAASLTLPAGSATAGIDEAVLAVPAIARNVRAGELRVRRDAAPPPSQPEPGPGSRRVAPGARRRRGRS